MDGRCQMQPRKGQRLGEVGFPLCAGAALARIDLQDDVPGKTPLSEVLQHSPRALVTSAWHEMLIFD
jgi:hypothetical protein